MKQFDMTIPTMQLMEHNEATFNKSSTTTRYSSIKEIIATDENSAAFIREVLDDENYTALERDNPLFEFAKSRAQHSVLTFFIGLAFLDFCGFRRVIAKTVLHSDDEKDVISLWILATESRDVP